MAKPSCMFPSPRELGDDLMVNVGELEVGIGNGGQGCQVVVLGCSMTRRKSRVCIELGVQPSRFAEPFWNELVDFKKIESIRLRCEPIRMRCEPIRICTGAKALHLKSIRG
ncbi:hypothetical protein PIB30_049902 [Stylosanthes scabra]|uniref:Uncharacterized protein n=1 Tax=Stylosanthes scabra TaxID=79078 RepID=A0ABU6YHZ6_9FABA|nr:hypothetical protein [Stylosanthes scabra]